MSAGESGFEIGEWEDERLILPLLERDRRWSAYALCDLDPPYRNHTRFIGAGRAGAPAALVVLFALPNMAALLPFGDVHGLAAILAGRHDILDEFFYIGEDRHLPALTRLYTLESRERMSRMTVAASELLPPPPSPLPVKRLTPRDKSALDDLYRLWGPASFDLQVGIYYGVEVDGRLVAVAGTHCWSKGRGVAAIGGVFTHPEYRGRGLATATTGAVAATLAREGIELIVLNVRADNAPAVAAYTRLGFKPWLTFTEGRASRTVPPPSVP